MSQYVEIEDFILIHKIYKLHVFLSGLEVALQTGDEKQIQKFCDMIPHVVEQTRPIVIQEKEENHRTKNR